MRYAAILFRLADREATYLQITYFRGRRKRGKEKEAESTCLDYNPPLFFSKENLQAIR